MATELLEERRPINELINSVARK